MSQETALNQGPTEASKEEDDGFAAWLLKFGSLMAVAPLYSLYMDGAKSVTERQTLAGGSPRDRHERDVHPAGKLQSFGLYIIFPILLIVITTFAMPPAFVVFGAGLLALLATAKRRAAKRLVPYRVSAVLADFCKPPVAAAVGLNLLVLITAIGCLPFLSAPAFLGFGFILGYPAVLLISRQRVLAWQAYEEKLIESRRIVGIAMGCTPAQLGSMYIQVAGEKEDGTYRIRATDLPFEIVSHLPGVEDRLTQFIPHLAVDQADTTGLVLVMATDGVVAQRLALAASGGLVASSEPVGGATYTPHEAPATDGFLPGEIF